MIFNCYNSVKMNIAIWCQKCFTHDSEESWHLFRSFCPRSLIIHSLSSDKRWHRQFKRFREVSDFTLKSKETQVNRLIYLMGEKTDGILYSFGLRGNDKKSYNTVSNKFKAHFVKQSNPIYEQRSLICIDRKENL